MPKGNLDVTGEYFIWTANAGSPRLDAYIVRRLGLGAKAGDIDWTRWNKVLNAVHNPKHEVTVGLVGKYIDLPDAYLSVTEAMRAGGFHHDAKVRIRWVASDECETEAGAQRALGGVDAVLVPGGFGVRGIEGKVGALRWAREKQVPTPADGTMPETLSRTTISLAWLSANSSM